MHARPGVVAALAALTSTVVMAPQAPAVADGVPVNQTYRVPASHTLTLHGHGFGHGRGMSQYGAYGAARRGLGYRRIVDFYYPGTSWGIARGRVRVLLTAATTTNLVVSPTAGLRVRDLGSGSTYRLPAIHGVRRWRLAVDGTRAVLGYLTHGWHHYRPGGLSRLVGDGQFRADRPMTLWTPSGSRRYTGALRAASPTRGSSSRDTVNVVSLDTYVQGVVPAEMPASWSIEAVKAQAVAARTYAAWSRAQHPDRYWQICDTSACQVYRGVSGELARSNGAVTATARQILTYGGRAAFTQFSSSSGGWSVAGGTPYLRAKADPYDDNPANPVHDWTARLTAHRIELAYPRIGAFRRLHVFRRDGHGQWRGRVLTLALVGTRGHVTLTGDAFRSRFGLLSSWFGR